MLSNFKIIAVYVLLGAGIFYFLVHPFTMVIYWFDFSHTAFSFPVLWSVLKSRLIESFTFNMMGMGTALMIFGGILGFVFGLFRINIKNKKRLIIKQEHLLKKDIVKLIETGESEWVEFKSSIRYDYVRKETNRALELVIAKTIAGFMNAKGGKLIIGVDDSGKPLDINLDYKTLKHKNKDGYERRIYEIISTFLGQSAGFSVHISFYLFNDKEICIVDVDASKQPVYLAKGDQTIFYVRNGNATYPLTVKETVDYLKMKE
jgi:hypothetical protein